jgi:hypothetical protein
MRIWKKKEKESELKQREARRTTVSGNKWKMAHRKNKHSEE